MGAGFVVKVMVKFHHQRLPAPLGEEDGQFKGYSYSMILFLSIYPFLTGIFLNEFLRVVTFFVGEHSLQLSHKGLK